MSECKKIFAQPFDFEYHLSLPHLHSDKWQVDESFPSSIPKYALTSLIAPLSPWVGEIDLSYFQVKLSQMQYMPVYTTFWGKIQ